jgi:hypothetical protein
VVALELGIKMTISPIFEARLSQYIYAARWEIAQFVAFDQNSNGCSLSPSARFDHRHFLPENTYATFGYLNLSVESSLPTRQLAKIVCRG